MAEKIALCVNEQRLDVEKGTRLEDLRKKIKSDADLFIINGFPVDREAELHADDQCWILKRGEKPALEEMQNFLYARHTPGVQRRIQDKRVGVMGLGGLGSLVAIALARIGVGTLLLVDYDVVEPTNLNRQQYFWDQIGLKKTEAMQDNIQRINPYVKVEAIDVRLTESTIPAVFQNVDALAECFDDPAMKASACRAVLNRLKGLGYVGSSGLAGYGDNNTIRTLKIHPNMYIVGDQATAARPGVGLMAPRVGIAAHQQANQILRILLQAEND